MTNSQLTVDRYVFLPPGVFIARLTGQNRFNVSMRNAERLCERFQQGGLGGLVIDYSGCDLGHQPHEFRHVAQVFEENMPKGTKMAYVYRDSQLGHILVITRLLNAAGLKVRGFTEPRAAEDWVFEEMGENRADYGDPHCLDGDAPEQLAPDA